jgi:hypothetical protein
LTWHEVTGNWWGAAAGNGGAIATTTGKIARCQLVTAPSYLVAMKAYADSVLGSRTVDWADCSNRSAEILFMTLSKKLEAMQAKMDAMQKELDTLKKKAK